MPIYEFSCLTCRHKFEVFGNFASRDQRQVCPSCEGTKTKALFSTFAVSAGQTSESMTPSSGGCGCAGGCACSN